MNDHINAFGLTLLVVPVISLFAVIGVIPGRQLHFGV